MKNRFNPIIPADDDNLIIPQVGSWTIKKYQYVGGYCELFTNSMKNKWDNLVYIDLFSGSGYVKIKESNKIIYGSPLIALSNPTPFSSFIFCEQNEEKLDALQKRVKKLFPDKDVKFVYGDSNERIETIIAEIPKFSKRNTGLSFGFVDPYSLNLHFNTIRRLSSVRIDFLILLAFYMDANRNFRNYFLQENHKIADFLDDSKWREYYEEGYIDDPVKFVKFLGARYRQNMEHLDYIPTDDFVKIDSARKNLPLYYLAFFSKSDLGNKFWKEVQKYSNPQLGINF